MMKLLKGLIKEGIEKLGLEVSVELKEAEKGIEIITIPNGIEETDGFKIFSLVRWKSVITQLAFGPYSLPFIHEIQNPSLEKRTLSQSFANACVRKGYKLKFQINGKDITVDKNQEWPSVWKSFILELQSNLFDTDNEEITTDVIIFEQQTVLGIVLSLTDGNEMFDKEISQEFEKLPEGAKTLVEVNKYERNKKNRTACINFYGPICAVCEMDFEKKYGKLGKGFIHVHHKIPVSQIGKNYLIDPISDLIPVCPNCHYMLHKKDIPYTVDELKLMIKKNE